VLKKQSIETLLSLAVIMRKPSAEEELPDADLRDQLHAMESKVRKLRDIRNTHHDEAKRAADKRNNIQSQYREHREKLDLDLAEVRAIRSEVKAFKERRNAIQAQIKDLIGQSKSQRGAGKDVKSATFEYNKLTSEVENLEHVFETRGGMSAKKEKETMESLKRMRRRLSELEPEVEEMALIKVDLSNRDEAIKALKVEADAAHQSMIEAVDRAKEASKDLDEQFTHRDFLKSEGDRFHNEFIAGKEKADEVHQKIVKMMDEVNEARDKLKMARVERESWMSDHNNSVKKMMKTGAESEDVANALVDTLLNSGSLTFGGTMSGDEGRVVKRGSSRKKKMRRVDVSASRSRK